MSTTSGYRLMLHTKLINIMTSNSYRTNNITKPEHELLYQKLVLVAVS